MTIANAYNLIYKVMMVQSEGSIERQQLSIALKELDTEFAKETADLVEALHFYADPESYHAIGLMIDRPAGGFADDFSFDHGHKEYDREMPGKMAREVLLKLGYLVKEKK